MNHNFRVLSETPVVHTICDACGLISVPSVLDIGGCRGEPYTENNNREEHTWNVWSESEGRENPNPEILRQLGHGLK